MHEDNNSEYRPVSFIANFQTVDEQTPSKSSDKPTFSTQIYYCYVILLSLSEYLLLFFLRNYYFAYSKMIQGSEEIHPDPDSTDQSSTSNAEIEYSRYWDSEVIKYFFFRLLSLGALMLRNPNSIFKVRYVFSRLFTAYSGGVFLLYGVVIWVALVSVLNTFLITNVILMVHTQSYYQLLANVLKGYPLKKLDYKFLALFSLVIVLFIILKLEKFPDVVLLIVCGYFFYTREEIARVNLDYEEIEILSYFTKGAVLILFAIKFLINLEFDMFSFSSKDLLVGAVVCGLDYFRVFCYKKVSEATSDMDSSYFRGTSILILVIIAFLFDLFTMNSEYSIWHYLLSAAGIGVIGYYNKAFLMQIVQYSTGKKQPKNALEIELKSDA